MRPSLGQFLAPTSSVKLCCFRCVSAATWSPTEMRAGEQFLSASSPTRDPDLDADVRNCLNQILRSVDLCSRQGYALSVMCPASHAYVVDGGDADRSDFCWEEFLAKNGCMAAAPTSFRHVQTSTNLADEFSGYAAVLTVHKTTGRVEAFWPAEVKKSCGFSLQLHLIGTTGAGPKARWYDLTDKANPIATIDFCLRHRLPMEPPKLGLKMVDSSSQTTVEQCNLVLAKYVSAATQPIQDQQKDRPGSDDLVTFTLPMHRIKVGQLVDVHEKHDPRSVWPAKVISNVGGRLQLKFVEAPESLASFYEFYLSERIHPFGSVFDDDKQRFGWRYRSPGGGSKTIDRDFIKKMKKNAAPDSVFRSRDPMPVPHKFTVGMCLEMLDPDQSDQFYPAVVVDVINEYYFVVEIDRLSGNDALASMFNDSPGPCYVPASTFVCHQRSPGLVPSGWCAKNHVRLGMLENFDWSTYPKLQSGSLAPAALFEMDKPVMETGRGFKLEAVDPSNPAHICAATIARTVRPFIWIHYDSSYLCRSRVVDLRTSTDVFNCGWCAANGYTMRPPLIPLTDGDAVAAPCFNACMYATEPPELLHRWERPYMPAALTPSGGAQWCPPIYFNASCYCGTEICRHLFRDKPKSVGPGPVVLLLPKLLSLVLSSAHHPRELLTKLRPTGCHNPFRRAVQVKVKHNTKRYRGLVDICTKTAYVAEWLRQLCIFLEACPNLLSFQSLRFGTCPYGCSRWLMIDVLHTCGDASRRWYLPHRPGRPKSNRRRAATFHGSRASNAASGTRTKRTTSKPAKRPLTRPAKGAPAKRRTKVLDAAEAEEQRGADVAASGNNFVTGSNDADGASGGNTSDSSSSSSVSAEYRMAAKEEVALPDPNASTLPNRVEAKEESLEKPLTLITRNIDNNQPKVTICIPTVHSNPIAWTTKELCQWLEKIDIGALVIPKVSMEAIDGEAFMLLTLPDVQTYLGLKLGPALKLGVVINNLRELYRRDFLRNFSSLN